MLGMMISAESSICWNMFHPWKFVDLKRSLRLNSKLKLEWRHFGMKSIKEILYKYPNCGESCSWFLAMLTLLNKWPILSPTLPKLAKYSLKICCVTLPKSTHMDSRLNKSSHGSNLMIKNILRWLTLRTSSQGRKSPTSCFKGRANGLDLSCDLSLLYKIIIDQ